MFFRRFFEISRFCVRKWVFFGSNVTNPKHSYWAFCVQRNRCSHSKWSMVCRPNDSSSFSFTEFLFFIQPKNGILQSCKMFVSILCFTVDVHRHLVHNKLPTANYQFRCCWSDRIQKLGLSNFSECNLMVTNNCYELNGLMNGWTGVFSSTHTDTQLHRIKKKFALGHPFWIYSQ